MPRISLSALAEKATRRGGGTQEDADALAAPRGKPSIALPGTIPGMHTGHNHQVTNRAVRAAAHRHHYDRPPGARVISRESSSAAGPVFAFVQPLTHVVETQAPNPGLLAADAATSIPSRRLRTCSSSFSSSSSAGGRWSPGTSGRASPARPRRRLALLGGADGLGDARAGGREGEQRPPAVVRRRVWCATGLAATLPPMSSPSAGPLSRSERRKAATAPRC